MDTYKQLKYALLFLYLVSILIIIAGFIDDPILLLGGGFGLGSAVTFTGINLFERRQSYE